MLAMINIRKTTEADEPAIRKVHETAFGPQAGNSVADLTIALFHDPSAQPLLSLLAGNSRTPIGHILFTSVLISGTVEPVRAHILAPLAVLPEAQRQGIGRQLVEHGLAMLTESGCELVFVLGHPEYYPRFGFQPAGPVGLSAPYPIPEEDNEAWMVLELFKGKLENIQGTVECATALSKPEHWRE